MVFFRICKEKYSHNLIASGVENRWNKKGEFVVYASESRSSATLESIVHRNSVSINEDYKILTISVTNFDLNCEEIKVNDLPKKWTEFKNLQQTKDIGSKWFQERNALLLKIPSAIIHEEHNYIINTSHPKFKTDVKIQSIDNYFWDNRLLNL